MVYDCFPFFNELDLLEIRLNVLKDVVDRFVIVEAGETHTGKPKPFYFEENRGRFAEFLDRIEYVKVEKFPDGCKTAWWRENIQRNAIAEGLKGAKDDDTVIISDLDEIPRPEKIAEWVGTPGVKRFQQEYYAFYLNYHNVRWRRWSGTQMLSYRDFKSAYDGLEFYENEFLIPELNEGTTASKIRARDLPRSRGGTLTVPNGGWHFTCLGGVEAVARKMASFAHQEYNPGDGKIDLAEIKRVIESGGGVFWKMNCFGERIGETFPKYIRENQAKYPHLVFAVTPEYERRVRWARFGRTLQGRWIQFTLWLCPPALHNWLHLIKMRLLRADGR